MAGPPNPCGTSPPRLRPKRLFMFASMSCGSILLVLSNSFSKSICLKLSRVLSSSSHNPASKAFTFLQQSGDHIKAGGRKLEVLLPQSVPPQLGVSGRQCAACRCEDDQLQEQAQWIVVNATAVRHNNTVLVQQRRCSAVPCCTATPSYINTIRESKARGA